MSVLSVTDARKAFGSLQALTGASFDLRPTEMLGLLGPNGAGKTTLVRALAGRVRLNSGTIEMFGRVLAASDRRDGLGVVPQELALYPLLNARENLQVFGRLNGIPKAELLRRIEWALEWTGLADRARESVKNFSGGMRRRLNIACGVLHEPKVVLLDEPTVGVDPQSRERIYEMLARLRDSGVSLLLTTHQLEEAEARCDRIVVIDHGRIVASGTLRELIDQTVGGHRLVALTLDRAPAGPLAGFEVDPGSVVVRASVQDVAAELPALLHRAAEAGFRVLDVQVRGPSLHSVFIHLTGRELRE